MIETKKVGVEAPSVYTLFTDSTNQSQGAEREIIQRLTVNQWRSYYLLVVLGTIAGFLAIVEITNTALDDLEDRVNEKRFKVLNEFVKSDDHVLDRITIALISFNTACR